MHDLALLPAGAEFAPAAARLLLEALHQSLLSFFRASAAELASPCPLRLLKEKEEDGLSPGFIA